MASTVSKRLSPAARIVPSRNAPCPASPAPAQPEKTTGRVSSPAPELTTAIRQNHTNMSAAISSVVPCENMGGALVLGKPASHSRRFWGATHHAHQEAFSTQGRSFGNSFRARWLHKTAEAAMHSAPTSMPPRTADGPPCDASAGIAEQRPLSTFGVDCARETLRALPAARAGASTRTTTLRSAPDQSKAGHQHRTWHIRTHTGSLDDD